MLTFDMREFEQASRDMHGFADQIPFALANAMTSAAFKTKEALVAETWPQHVKVRNNRFLGKALRIQKARKTALRVAIFDNLDREFLVLHADGGLKVGRGGQLAIPERRVAGKRNSKGVPAGLRPSNLPPSKGSPTGSFKVQGKKGGQVIYQRWGSYQKSGDRKKPGVDNRHRRLMYVLKPSAPIRADVPFEADFEHVMTAEIRRSFPIAMRNAMLTRGLKGKYDRLAAVGRRANSSHGNSRRART